MQTTRRTGGLPRVLWVVGPGLMVMLADTDAGSVVTASDSGATWGYRLLLLELLLIPVLYVVMELTVRLGIVTGKGYTELVRETFGPRWSAVVVTALLVSATGALVTEFAGIAGSGALFGVSPRLSVSAAALLLVLLLVSGSYRRVEVVGIALGLFELSFVAAAVLEHPSAHDLAAAMGSGQPLGDRAYLALVAANVGAVIMPWMLFYQQGAVVDKGLRPEDLRAARIDTALGAVLTQIVMAAVLVASACALHDRSARALTSIQEISAALTPLLGADASRFLLALGMVGAAFVASIVVTVAAAWAVAEARGKRRSLNARAREAPLFYGLAGAAIAVGASLVLVSHSLVRLAVDVEILNALLLPVVLGLLLALSARVLPRTHRDGAPRRAVVGLATGVVAVVAIVSLGFALGL